MLIEVADVRFAASESARSAKAAFTSRWKSSKSPSTSSARTGSSQQVSCNSWKAETRPFGYRITARTAARPSAAQPTAPPVSPDVAANTVSGSAGSPIRRSEEHTSELQSLMRRSYAVFCLKKKKQTHQQKNAQNENEK